MSDPVPPPPPAALAIFGDQLPVAQRYAQLLATDGDLRGLLGPRELPRLWDRHLLNCAVLTELVEHGARVVDVGSGAGLPGLVMGIRRPDLSIDLLEPLARRADFLAEAVTALELSDRVRVHRGRAEEGPARTALGNADVVVARAVAPLGRLVEWCIPLVRPGGTLLALKGVTATTEVAGSIAAVRRSGGLPAVVREVDVAGVAAHVVVVGRRATVAAPAKPAVRKGSRG